MKLKANKILNMYEALMSLADRELSLDTACIIAKNLQELSIAKEVIEIKRNNIIIEYAEKDEDGNVIENDGKANILDIPSCTRKINDLLSSETEVQINSIPKKEFANIKMTAKEILPLLDIFAE